MSLLKSFSTVPVVMSVREVTRARNRFVSQRTLLCLAAALVMVLVTGCSVLSPRFPTTLKQVSEAEPTQSRLDIQRWQTAEGATVLFVPSPTLPMLDVRLVFDAGSARDGDKEGLASLTSALFGEGAKDLSVDDIALGFENLGANFSSGSYRDMALIELRTLTDAEFFQPATDLFIRAVGTPTFPQTSLERIRAQTLLGLKRQKQVPGPQVQRAFNRAVFGQHPYAHDSSGSETSLPTIKRADIEAFYREYYAAGNAVIAMTGDLDLAAAKALAQSISAALPVGEHAVKLDTAERPQARVVEHIDFNSSQTTLMLGQQSIWRGHPDWVALYVGNQILGGSGFASILTEEVREKRGFVYGIGSGISPMASAGPFTVSLQTANDNADEALAVTLQLVRDYIANGPSEAQIENARNDIIGNFPLSIAENDQIVGQLGSIGFYGLPLDYLSWFENEVRQLTAEQVRDALQRNIDPDTLAIVSVGPVAPNLPEVPAGANSKEDGKEINADDGVNEPASATLSAR
jgi:zinc protease